MLRSFLGRPKTVRVPINASGAHIDIQQVKVKKRTKPVLNRFLTVVLVTYCVSRTLSWVASDDFKTNSQDVSSQIEQLRKNHAKTNEVKGHSDQWKMQHANIKKSTSTAGKTPPTTVNEDHAEDVHIMLPIWFRKRKNRNHTLQDPEWQEARDFMLDPKAVKTVKRNLCEMVFRIAKHHTKMAESLRYIQFNGVAGNEFDIAPQMATQTTYEVPCIFIKPSLQIEVGWQPLSATNGARIKRAFHPIIFAHAFYAGFTTFAITSLAITAGRVAKAIAGPGELRVQVVAKNPDSSHNKGLGKHSHVEMQPKAKQPLSASELDQSTFNWLRPSSPHFSWKAHQTRAQSMTYTEAVKSARKAFTVHYLMHKSAAEQTTTPGLCIVKGHIVMKGKLGDYRIEVAGFYSPKEKAMVGLPLITGTLIIPNWAAMEAMEEQKQKMTAQQPAGKSQVSTPEAKQSAQPATADQTARPSPEGKK